jgi:Trk K+ transport system NAD-binding subunit
MPENKGVATFLSHTPMKPRIIVCGLSRTGYRVFRLLKQQGAMVVGIHPQPLTDRLDNIVIGELSAASTLIAAGIREADTLVITHGDDAVNLAVLTQARVLNPRIRIINRLFNTSLGDRLDYSLPDHFSMSVSALSAPIFAFAAMGDRAIGQLQLFEQTWAIREEYIDDEHPWLGRKLSELWEDRSRMLIYYLPGYGEMDLVTAVAEGQTLQMGDRLIIANQPQGQTVRRTLKQGLLGFLSGLRTFQTQIKPTILISLTLLFTILIATLTYTVANSHISAIDALYFSVGMITGAGGSERVAEQAPDSVKVFTVMMMLVGAAVVGIFYALLNDFVLGTHFRQLWDTAQIPDRQHYIVCGLGGTGVKVVRQLWANGCEVVVIERDANNRFLNEVRSLKIPIIQSDANLMPTIQSVHLAEAAAVLVMTSNDVTNLEIALTVKGIAPKIPVIVRNQTPQFAPLAQQVFEFEAVLTPAELAAPSFAAAALGGRILGTGMTADILWVALATLITPAHPFYGQRVKEVAMDADLVPLYLETRRQIVHGWSLLEAELETDDILYLTIPAMHLDRLWRGARERLNMG